MWVFQLSLPPSTTSTQFSSEYLMSRLQENARLSAGKAPHPFFARPKVGGARSLFGDEPSQIPEVRSVVQASNCSEVCIPTLFNRQGLICSK